LLFFADDIVPCWRVLRGKLQVSRQALEARDF